MSIEQHAEAAAKDIASWMRLNAHLFPSVGNQADWAKLIQLRIDEVTEPLKARIAELEGLGPLIEEYGLRCKAYGLAIQSLGSDEQFGLRKMRDEILAKINTILKGGAS